PTPVNVCIIGLQSRVAQTRRGQSSSLARSLSTLARSPGHHGIASCGGPQSELAHLREAAIVRACREVDLNQRGGGTACSLGKHCRGGGVARNRRRTSRSD